ncbi:hypothetical protein IMG5_191650 [Ichthyophthirius multifiliis]|uniref:Uncharacterized protein n=1 Tax=Ichthyophthirius multifiliis TaxID=5932 RepID=G0R4E3_ICHMU|nr:hypothetical protein IMG5_191650 [Ichthyophthirius multifiliis]EGR27662.1 hypothetical protein IMG5_191650 [Ichthyophthirius multifiliis]|eukprot:XP_004025114.1 hypothetical protein IMG5_191650 [Ichthyophthirius multifiliis]
MVLSQEPVKMNVFLQFLFDLEKVNKYLREKWIQIYDISYIDNQIITQALEEKLPLMADILGHLSQKATGKKSDLVNTLEQTLSLSEKNNNNQNLQQKKEITVPIPFNLTKPKPKALPEPIKIEKKVKANPIPQTIFKTNIEQINQKGKERLENIKKQVEQEYKESKIQKFEFQLDKRPTNIQKIYQEVEEKLNQELQFEKKNYRPPPTFKEPVEIKHNIAAILREDAKIKSVQEQEAKRLKDLEWNMRDSAEFENWKKEMKYKEQIEILEQQQRTKIEMELAREGAMKAFNEKIEKNKLQVLDMKDEQKRNQEEIIKKKEENILENKQVVLSVQETRDNASKEIAKLIEKKKLQADELKQKIEEELSKIKEEEEVERKKKEEIIRQIRELQKQPKQRTKGFDPTETMGYGLLQEMSLVQLREKLNEMKIIKEIEKEQRRENNLKKKDEKLQDIEVKVQEIKENSEMSLSNAKTKLEQSKKLQNKKKKHDDQQLQLPGPRYDAINSITEQKDEEDEHK